VRAVIPHGLAVYSLAVKLPVLVKAKVAVDTAHTIRPRQTRIIRADRVRHCVQFAIRVKNPKIAAVLAELAADSHDAEISLPSKEGIVRSHRLAGRLIICEQSSHRPRPFLAREADAVEGI